MRVGGSTGRFFMNTPSYMYAPAILIQRNIAFHTLLMKEKELIERAQLAPFGTRSRMVISEMSFNVKFHAMCYNIPMVIKFSSTNVRLSL